MRLRLGCRRLNRSRPESQQRWTGSLARCCCLETDGDGGGDHLFAGFEQKPAGRRRGCRIAAQSPTLRWRFVLCFLVRSGCPGQRLLAEERSAGAPKTPAVQPIDRQKPMPCQVAGKDCLPVTTGPVAYCCWRKWDRDRWTQNLLRCLGKPNQPCPRETLRCRRNCRARCDPMENQTV